MKILLIEDDPQISTLIRPILETTFKATIQEMKSIQSAIELLEGPWEPADLIICDYHGSSMALMKCMLEFCQNLPCIFIVDESFKFAELNKVRGAFLPDPVIRKFLTKQLIERIRELSGKSAPASGQDVAELIDPEAKAALDEQNAKLDQMLKSNPPPAAEARAVLEDSLEVIQDLSSKLGFSPQIQTIASKSVELTLKLIGTKPKLSAITENLKRNEGKYIASHSVMLAEICCAIACRVGWNSAPTFFKLTLASYLHDMAIKSNELAKCRSLDEAKRLPSSTQEGFMSFKLHTVRAAEYATKFHEIPPDVDTIVAQHHELPDGSGFPRGLFSSQIAPLSSLFIIAEDMFHFFLENEDGSGTIANFVLQKNEYYKAGVFKKIMKALSGIET